ncbi:hypothetical protein LTR95_001424 [Oleoguttula sp. CCFEE 5521]
MIDLIELAPPESELLRVCQQVYVECKTLYTSAVRQYWDQDFFIDVLTVLHSTKSFEHVTDKVLSNITSLLFVPPRYNPGKVPRLVVTTIDGTYHYSEVGPGQLSELDSIISVQGVVDKANEKAATPRELCIEVNTTIRIHSTWGWPGAAQRQKRGKSRSGWKQSGSLFK